VAAAEAATPIDAAIEPEEAAFTPEELDTLVAPVALYPDPLLAQVFVASTYPIDVVKADRWIEENKDLASESRAEAAEAKGWDPSVTVLAAGFPTIVGRMSDDIEWTETLGDAVLAQSDDTLDAVQRMRAQAAAMGNLDTNEAQVVTVEGDAITIVPATPEVVYVPTYDSQAVYTTAATAPPVVVNSTDPGFSTGTLITTGILAFGAGMLVNEIFDDDDDDWHGYWGPGYYGPRAGWVDWDDGYFRPRPGWGGGNFSGNDVDIDIGEINVDRDRLDIDRDGRWRPDDERRDRARDNIADRKGGGDSLGGRRDRDNLRRDQTSGRDRDRDELRNRMAKRSEGGGAELKRRDGAAKAAPKKSDRKATAFSREGGNLTKSREAAKRGDASRAKADRRREGTSAGKAASAQTRAAARPERPRGEVKPQRKSSGGGSALGKRSSGKQAGAAGTRGKQSRGTSGRRG
jgi:hypothetical protein